MEFSFYLTPAELIILLLTLLFFTIQAIFFFKYFVKLLRFTSPQKEENRQSLNANTAGVSVIVYAKNESENLENFLPLILEQEYPLFEVIVINDGSTDETKEVLDRFSNSYPNLYCTFVPDKSRNISRKKLSVTLGIKAAKYDIVLLTNANCKPTSTHWIAGMMRNFTPKIEVVLGYSFIPFGKGLVSRFMAFDSFTEKAKFLSSAINHAPYMGYGTNLAYRKSLFFERKGFSALLKFNNGEDDLFVNEIANKNNTAVEIMPDHQMMEYYDEKHAAWKEDKYNYKFTSSYLKTHMKFVFNIELTSRILFFLSAVLLLLLGLNHIEIMVIAILLLLLRYISYMIYYAKCRRVFSLPQLAVLFPLYDIIQPLYNIPYNMNKILQRRRNFTNCVAK